MQRTSTSTSTGTGSATGSAMEAKATRFLAQFARAVFAQWTQQQQEARELFWQDAGFLHALLEEAVAKLPRGALKSHLARELQPLVAQLAALLRDKHAAYLTQQQAAPAASASASASLSQGALLNEELTELALAQAAAATASDSQQRLAGVLALDTALDVAPHAAQHTESTPLARASRLAEQFALVAARGYESPLQQAHKRGLALQRLAECVQQHVAAQCAASSNWDCLADSVPGRELQQLGALLERVVMQDAVALALPPPTASTAALAAPWTAFYRPEEPAELHKVALDAEMAKIYGSLLALAVYFPLDVEQQSESEDTSDDEASDDGDAATHKQQQQQQQHKQQHKQQPLGAVAQAQRTTRQVLLAAQIRERSGAGAGADGGQWLLQTLSFLHALPKPATYVDEDEDAALEPQDRRALLETLGDVYTRAFAGAAVLERFQDGAVAGDEAVARQDGALLEAVVCVRHAARFMRQERQRSLAAVTTAMTQLAGVPLPASFWAWLEQERRSAASASAPAKLAQRLWKASASKPKRTNLLLSSTDVTDAELAVVHKSYEAYLQRLAAGTANQQQQQQQQQQAEPVGDADASESQPEQDSLFFVDNAGGEADESKKRKSASKKRAAKKRHRANKRLRTQQQAASAVQVAPEPQAAS